MKNTTQYIALFGSRIFEQVPLQFINEFREAALQRGYKLLIFTTYAETPENNEGFWGEYQIIHLIEYFQVQAFVLLTDTIRYDGLTDNILKITKKRGIPAFSVGSRELDCYNLTIDYSSGFEQMVRHVVEDHGCRIVDMIAGGKGEYYSEMRVRAYRKVLEENGIAREIPVHFQPWNQCFRFACVKRELLEGYEVPESMQEMATLMRMEEGKFERPGEVFPVEEIMPRMEEAMLDNHPIDTFYIRLLTTGMQVYGYLIEGTRGLDARTLQRSNEFTMYLSNMINIVLHNAELSEADNRIAELSIRDSLTGLLNRRGFDQMLEKHLLKQEGKILFLFSADMDRLKYINDTFGHAEGDFAIKTLAHAIEKAGGQESVCARFGGDEFVCAIVGSREGEYTEEDFCKRVDEAIAVTRGVGEKPYPIQVSIGCSSMGIHEGLERDKMFLAADRIMYEKKAARKRARIS